MRFPGALRAGQPQPYPALCSEQTRLFVRESLLQALHLGDRCVAVIHVYS